MQNPLEQNGHVTTATLEHGQDRATPRHTAAVEKLGDEVTAFLGPGPCLHLGQEPDHIWAQARQQLGMGTDCIGAWR